MDLGFERYKEIQRNESRDVQLKLIKEIDDDLYRELCNG